MESSEIMARVKKVVAQVLKIDKSTIDDNANFIFDLGADSMQSVALIAGFEQEFGIEMEEDKALQIQTVVDAVKFISGHLK
ncbi:MAG: acyl carrier protein [Ignavibacteriales bacterium]|nr:acyl carrier protein [Ignavibacteriales bacterium]